MDSVAAIRLSWKLFQEKVSVDTIAKSIGKHRATVFRWIQGIKKLGIQEFVRRYREAKKRKRQIRIDYRAENLIKDRRREKPECGQKIAHWLQRKHGITVSVAQIYRILRRHFTLRSKWKKWTKRPPLPKAEAPRQVIQVDTVHLGELFSFNFIDTYTKESISIIQAEITSSAAAYALEKAFVFFGGTIWIQTDNGSEYKSIFRKVAKRYCQKLRQITPYQKEENGFIESYNRTFRKECVGWCHYRLKDKDRLQQRVNAWLDEYHMERPHMSLNMMTPQEYVHSLSLNN
jgi:transposase InsO family protein